jgi:hypothetical protein
MGGLGGRVVIVADSGFVLFCKLSLYITLGCYDRA